MKKIVFFILWVACSFWACEAELNTEIPLPDTMPLPVVLCFASSTQPTLAYIGKTTPLGAANVDTTPLAILKVEIRDAQSQTIASLSPTLTPGLYTSFQAVPFQEGLQYQIYVETADFGPVYSTLEPPAHPTALDSVWLESVSSNSGYLNLSCLFQADTQHPQQQYGLKTLFYANNHELFDNEQYLHIPYNTLSNAGATGAAVVSSFQVPNIAENKVIEKYKVVLFHLSPALGTFLNSINANEGNVSDVLTEPSSVHTNIINGVGVFGFFDTDTLVFIP